MFQIVRLRDPANTGREPQLHWWPRAELHQKHYEAQAHLMNFPGSQGLPLDSYRGLPSGCHDTLREMWSLRHDEGRLTHLLRAAILFQAARSSRGNAHHVFYGASDLPSLDELRTYYDQSLALAGCASPWHHSCTEVLPEYSYFGRQNPLACPFRNKDLSCPENLYIALDQSIEHRLQAWAPVALIYDEAGDPAVCAQIDAKRTAFEASRKNWAERQAAKEEAAAAALAARQALHPRCAEWPPSVEELAALAWQMPLRDVAQLFGVSDVAIKKACKARNIETPPRGYWLAYTRRKVGAEPLKRTKTSCGLM